MAARPDPSGLPAPLDSLPVELIEKWSISDDIERDLVMEGTSDDGLRELVSIFTPEMFDALNAYLDTDPAEAEWLLWLGLSASEALMDLRRRTDST
jgi:hypothetical protein